MQGGWVWGPAHLGTPPCLTRTARPDSELPRDEPELRNTSAELMQHRARLLPLTPTHACPSPHTQNCLKYEPEQRNTCAELMQHPYFGDGFVEWFEEELKQMLERDATNFKMR